jgi:hypothetical protein
VVCDQQLEQEKLYRIFSMNKKEEKEKQNFRTLPKAENNLSLMFRLLHLAKACKIVAYRISLVSRKITPKHFVG